MSATAITAMTPACTGSVTTRSAASGTLPAMFRLMTIRPWARTSRTRLLDVAAHQRARQDECAGARQSCDGAHGFRERLFADQRNRVHRDLLAADVVTIGFRDGADRHLSDLRAASDDDDSLAVDPLERRRDLQAPDDRQRAELVEHRCRFGRRQDLEVGAAQIAEVAEDLDRRDVTPMAGDDPGELMQDAGAPRCGHENGDGFHAS